MTCVRGGAPLNADVRAHIVMDASKHLEWVRSMRLQLLSSAFELSNEHLQAASWTNPSNGNQHYTLVEFVWSSQLNDLELFQAHRDKGVINDAEYSALLPLVNALIAYSPPNNNWYDHDGVLRDPHWHGVTEIARSALTDVLSLSFNASQWLTR